MCPFRSSPTILAGVVQHTALTARAVHDPAHLVWQGTWNGGAEQPLPLDATHYGEYTLEVRTTFLGGTEQTVEVHFTEGERVE